MTLAKGKLLIAGMIGAIGIPYVVHDSQTQAMINREWKSLTGQELFAADDKGDPKKVLEQVDESSREALSKMQSDFDAKASELAKNDPRELLPESARAALRDASSRPASQPPEGQPVSDFGEIFRFDVIPKWIITRWGTVNRNLAGSEFEAFRVPVVTGKQPSDLSGALTYYFDANDVVQRISFLGSTYDEKRLVEFMTNKYQLKKEPALGPDLYGVRWSGKMRSALVIDFDPNTPRGQAPKMLVRFELNRPRGGNYGLSNEFATLLSGVVK
jgi:hypothetical protein